DQSHGNSLRCNEAQNSNSILQIGKDHQAHHGYKKPLAASDYYVQRDSNFDNIKKEHGLFVLNDMVTYYMCDLPKKDILTKSKFSAKLAGLPRFTTGKQLIEIGH
ncbi:15858_t:CDS:1, partial [Funneliformis geosporum]